MAATKVEKYLDINVMEAARQRARYLFSVYDSIIVFFSGGKDSLVVLELMEEVRIELGIEKKLDVVFLDEELISDSHVEFVDKIARSGRFQFYWVVAPFTSEKFILGKKLKYVQWDVTRKWTRTPPDYAVKIFDAGEMHESDVFNRLFSDKYRNACVCLGLRAAESRNRRLSVFKSTDHERPYIVQAASKYVEAKPIYDWQTKDIFKYFMDNKVEYAPVYDAQTWAKANLRVATPFTNEGAKSLDKLKKYDPVFFDRLMQVFPEMIVQERYYSMWDNKAIFKKYGVTEKGIVNYIDAELHGSDKLRAVDTVQRLFINRENDRKNPKMQEDGRPWVRYPLFYIFYQVIIGGYKRFIPALAHYAYTPEMALHEEAAAKKNELEAKTN